jgi:hypothetical protein
MLVHVVELLVNYYVDLHCFFSFFVVIIVDLRHTARLCKFFAACLVRKDSEGLLSICCIIVVAVVVELG